LPTEVRVLRDSGSHEISYTPRRWKEHITVSKGWRRASSPSCSIEPVIAKTFRLDEVADSHRYMESNAQVGKIVVTTA